MNISEHIKNNQICSIVGATATGKTALALKTARELLTTKKATRVHLLSADSRQVYKGLENLTGADLPANFTSNEDPKWPYAFWQNPERDVFLHGIAIIETHEEWSVAHFKKLFLKVVENLQAQEFLIVVGGTGFYQQQISQPAETLDIPQNQTLREKLAKLSLEELQENLQNLDALKMQNLNHSDRQNPRRLVRAIEVASFLQNKKTMIEKKESSAKFPIFYLQLDKEIRHKKIEQRVEERFAVAKAEVSKQLAQGKFSQAAASCTGFQELTKFLTGKISQQECLALWQKSEVQYAKRQDTWWKKRADLCYI